MCQGLTQKYHIPNVWCMCMQNNSVFFAYKQQVTADSITPPILKHNSAHCCSRKTVRKNRKRYSCGFCYIHCGTHINRQSNFHKYILTTVLIMFSFFFSHTYALPYIYTLKSTSIAHMRKESQTQRAFYLNKLPKVAVLRLTKPLFIVSFMCSYY